MRLDLNYCWSQELASWSDKQTTKKNKREGSHLPDAQYNTRKGTAASLPSHTIGDQFYKRPQKVMDKKNVAFDFDHEDRCWSVTGCSNVHTQAESHMTILYSAYYAEFNLDVNFGFVSWVPMTYATMAKS